MDIKEAILKQARIVPIASGNPECVDGRPGVPGVYRGFGYAGASMGLVLAVLRAVPELTAYEVVKAALEALNFQCHTDDHGSDNPEIQGFPLPGCGHCRLALTSLESYGLTQEAQEFFRTRFAGLLEVEQIEPVVLRGDHREDAVVIVHDREIRFPRVEEGGLQFFLYYPKVAETDLRILLKALDRESEFGVCWAAFKDHTNLTLKALADGKSVFDMHLVAGTIKLLEN